MIDLIAFGGVDRELELQLLCFGELRRDRQDFITEIRNCGELHTAVGGVGAGEAVDVFDELEDGLYFLENDDTDGRWIDAAAGTVEKSDAKFFFKFGDGGAERGLGDKVFLCGDGNGAILAGFLEAVELVEFHGDASFHKYKTALQLWFNYLIFTGARVQR